MENWEVNQKGRQIVLRARIDDVIFIFINIYAPNDLKKQLEFFEALKISVQKYADENIIIGGDLNCCSAPEDKKGGRPIEQKKQ